MAPRNKKKQSDEQRLVKKREAEKRRQERIKNNPQLLEIEKEKRHQKYLNRIKKKQLKPIKQQSEREKRQTRKKWRESAKTYRDNKRERREQEEQLKSNTPPASDEESQEPVPTSNDGRKISGRKRLIRNKTKAYRDLMALKMKVKKAEAKAERYKKRYTRLMKKQNVKTTTDLTPNSKVKRILAAERLHVTENVRKRLVFGELLRSQIKKSSKTLNFEGKRILRKCFDSNAVRKYKVKKALERLVGVNRARLSNKHKLIKCQIGSDILKFFERDDNSRICPGKKDTKTFKKDKRQKRFLCKNLKVLHEEFQNETNYKISYSLFCRFKPFWILAPKVIDRNTCLCKTHNNMEMLVSKLNSIKIIDHRRPEQIVNSLCCSLKTEECLFRQCEACKGKMIIYNEFSANDTTSFYKWTTEKEEKVIRGATKQIQKTTKKTISCTYSEIVDELDKSILKFMVHVGNLKHQHKFMREKKENLNEKEALIHVDFSENFSGKFANEVQSVHFGSSRIQLTLHTGVYYVKGSKPVSFCTVSESKDHNAAAIWAHLRPVLIHMNDKFPELDTCHFLSDSPSGQYRNKTMFYLLRNYLKSIVPGIKNSTWNYSEAGHGKGAPDGVGGLLKRTADDNIALGTDIMDIKSFMTVVREKCPSILLWEVNSNDIDRIQQFVISSSDKIKSVLKTMKIHQVTVTSNKIDYRSLSCWKCSYGDSCIHNYSIKQGTEKPGGAKNLKAKKRQQKSKLLTQPEESFAFEDTSGENFTPFSDPQKGDFIVVKFPGKRDIRYYVATIDEKSSEGLDVSCGRIIAAGKNLFKWPEPADTSFIDYDQVELRLQTPNFNYKNDRLVSFYFHGNDFVKMKQLNLF